MTGTGMRIGHGYDIHRLQPGGTLRLGGVIVSTKHSAVAHSDGDVLIHAIVDALLGALGLGDIGEHFRNDDPQWKGCESRVFLEHVMEKVRSSHLQVANIDATVLLERFKLQPYKRKMAATIGEMVQTGIVNVKAGTNEGCDAVGRGEAIAAHAVVLLAPAGGGARNG